MKRVTRWSPDTCACVFDYEWDDEHPHESREHKFSKIVNHCTAHSGLKADHAHFSHVVSENQTKNRVHAHVLEHVPRLAQSTANGPGVELRSDVEYRWEFVGRDHDRRLKVSFLNADLSNAERVKLRAAAVLLAKSVVLE